MLWGMIYLVLINYLFSSSRLNCGHSTSLNYTICTPTYNRYTTAHMVYFPVWTDEMVRCSALVARAMHPEQPLEVRQERRPHLHLNCIQNFQKWSFKLFNTVEGWPVR